MKKIFFLSFLLLSFLSCTKHKNFPEIGVIQIAEDPVLDISRLAAIKVLQDAGYEDGKNITINYKNAQGDFSNLIMILKAFESNQVDAILTVGTPTMSAAASNIKSIPVVFTVSFSPQQLGIDKPTNMTGAYDPLDMQGFIRIILDCIPGVNKIGLPFNPSEPNAEYASKQVLIEAEKQNIEVIRMPISNSIEVGQAAQALASKGVKAFVAAADNITYQGIPSISKVAEIAKIPIFVVDPYQTSKGAALGYCANYEEWGKTSGELLLKVLKGNKGESLPIIALKNFDIIINNQSAIKQGLIIPDSIKNKAKEILKK